MLQVAKRAKGSTCNWFCTAKLCAETANDADTIPHGIERVRPGEELIGAPQAWFLLKHLAEGLLMRDSACFYRGPLLKS